jgi:hypothetical protein
MATWIAQPKIVDVLDRYKLYMSWLNKVIRSACFFIIISLDLTIKVSHVNSTILKRFWSIGGQSFYTQEAEAKLY